MAVESLRNPQYFQWGLVPVFAFVMQLYFREIGKKNWHLILACVATFALEFFAEIMNALILHFTDHAALWMIGGRSSFLIFVGLNLEIMLMFGVAYIAFLKILPKDSRAKIFGIPNRWFFVLVNSLICVAVEALLNDWGVLIWSYKYWSVPHLWSIVLFAYAPSIVFLYWLYDMKSLKFKGTLALVLIILDAIGFGMFSTVLNWI